MDLAPGLQIVSVRSCFWQFSLPQQEALIDSVVGLQVNQGQQY